MRYGGGDAVHFLKFLVHFINEFMPQVRRPVLFPCFGVQKKEKHILLPLVADVAIEQGKPAHLIF